LPQEALFLFVCLFVGWFCLIFYLLSILAYGLSVHAVLNQNGTISSDSELLLSMRTSNACSKQASKHGGYNSGKKDAQIVSMTLAWVIFIIS
jgi:hypothetical protein